MLRVLGWLTGGAALLMGAGCGAAFPTGQAAPASTAASPTVTPVEIFTPSSLPSGTPAESETPSAAIEAYFSALAAGNCTTAFALLTNPLRARTGSPSALCSSEGDVQSAAVGPVNGNPSNGQVTVAAAVTDRDGSVSEESVVVVLQGGAWLVSDILTSPGQGGPGGDIYMGTVISSIQQQWLSQSHGASLTLQCSRSGSFPAVPGDAFTCSYTDTAGHRGTVTVTITSAQGSWTWTASG